METKPWGNPKTARVLVIGHDPRLQRTSTIADYCFFADYYFRPKPDKKNELRKYGLAESLFNYIRDLTTSSFSDDELLITNLCNEALPPSPNGKTVYIAQGKAEKGLKAIKDLLKDTSVKLIFPMSQQVNYWLQKLEFYGTDTAFVEKSEPRPEGVNSIPSYYTPSKAGAFKEICGNKYIADNQYYLFPILHVKNYPLKGKFVTAYYENYEHCKEEINILLPYLN